MLIQIGYFDPLTQQPIICRIFWKNLIYTRLSHVLGSIYLQWGRQVGSFSPCWETLHAHMSREKVLLGPITNCGTVLERWKEGWSDERILCAHFDGGIEITEYYMGWGISAVSKLDRICGEILSWAWKIKRGDTANTSWNAKVNASPTTGWARPHRNHM